MAPPHTTYVEGFAGGLSVLLNKFRSDVEIACDTHEELVNFYHVLVATPELLIEKVKQTSFAKLTFYAARSAGNEGDELTRAANFIARQRMSFSGCGGWAEGEGKKDGWETLPYDLEIVARRLKRVEIVCRNALEVLPEYDSPSTFFYLDPPYYVSTRDSFNNYVHEMKEMDHLRLLRLVRDLKGSVIISGYAHHMYDKELPGWDRVEIEVAVCSSAARNGEKTRKNEILWVKPQPLF
jgi:DNA adenine methylase